MSVDQMLAEIEKIEAETGTYVYGSTSSSSNTVVTPLPEANCVGMNADGSLNRQLRALKGYDISNNPIYTCATWRYFRVNCPVNNSLCSSLSGGYVAAITVANQRLW